jgi:hypothetical protein
MSFAQACQSLAPRINQQFKYTVRISPWHIWEVITLPFQGKGIAYNKSLVPMDRLPLSLTLSRRRSGRLLKSPKVDLLSSFLGKGAILDQTFDKFAPGEYPSKL